MEYTRIFSHRCVQTCRCRITPLETVQAQYQGCTNFPKIQQSPQKFNRWRRGGGVTWSTFHTADPQMFRHHSKTEKLSRHCDLPYTIS
jgi:hypothetical protein